MTGEKVTLTTEDQKLLERALMASTEKLYDINEETDGDRAIFAVLHGVAIGQLSPINSVERIKALFARILVEKEREIATFENREAEWNEAIANSLQNEEDAHRKLEAAEAALAAERERAAKVAEAWRGAAVMTPAGAMFGANTPNAIAAAIRAQGE